jgi:hypothetical protein
VATSPAQLPQLLRQALAVRVRRETA